MFTKSIKVKNIVVLLLSIVIVSCASTSVKESWILEGHNKSYKQPMIIGISDSQQTRRLYEDYMVAELNKKNINAIASHTLISSKQKIDRDTVIVTVKGTEIDAVIVSYLVSDEAVTVHRDSPLNTGYSSNVENNKVSDTLISVRGRSSSGEIVVLKNDLYDTQTKSLVWSVQTRSVAPESIDQVITEVTELLIKQLFDDKLLK